LVAKSIAVVGSSLSGVGKTVRSLSENILSVVLASETRAIKARVVLGGGASQEEAKNLYAHYNNKWIHAITVMRLNSIL
jgi:fructose-bisphosphate aldolase class 1